MKITLTSIILTATLILGQPIPARAQGDAKTASPSPDQLKKSIATLEQHAETRELRATELTNDIMSMDTRIESRIDRIVKMLEGVTDGSESQVRVAQLKQRAIEGLKNTIEYYDQKRRGLKSETMERDPKITRETLFSDIGVFDNRIEKRVNQILELAESMQSHEDYEKWRTVNDDSYWGWGGYRERNPKYYENRKQVVQTEKTRKQLTEELNGSIDRLDRRNREIRETLKKNITDQYREMLTTELDQNTELIESRQIQKEELTMARDPNTEAIGRDQALGIESMIEDMAEDLRRDWDSLFRIYAELNQERIALKTINDQLAKNRKLLEAGGNG